MQNSPAQEIQLAVLVDPSKPRDILSNAKKLFRASFGDCDFKPIDKAFLLAKRLYDGRFSGYLPCAVEYHDFTHSVAVFAASSRLIDGCVLSGLGIEGPLAGEILVAAMLHDAGYIREEAEAGGTGAQYTKVHVDRSSAFVLRQAEDFGLSGASARRVARMILGTDLARPWEGLEFESEAERLGAEILAAADLLGQMADRAYLEKLLFLYHEFIEAGIGGYECAFDILRKTASFYAVTKQRLDGVLGRVSGRSREHFAARYGLPKDLYREAIERQMAYLDTILADDSTNFRTKLKRMDLESFERDRSEAGFRVGSLSRGA